MDAYSHILSPVTVRGKTLRNRLLQAKCALMPKSLDDIPDFYIRTAKTGAAMVTVAIGSYVKAVKTGHEVPFSVFKPDMRDETTREVFRGVIDECHANGALVSASLMNIEPNDVNISDTPNWDEIPAHGDYNSMTYFNKPGISAERLEEMLQTFVDVCVDLQKIGFDAVTFYMSYRASILCNSLSPVLNQRKDKYGGDTNAERVRLTKELFERVRAACPDLIVEVQISGEEEAPGYTVADWLEYCKAWEGLADIIQVRGFDGSATHVSGVNMERHCPPNLDFARAFKAAGIDILISPVGGFGDPEDIERFIADGETDLVSIARQFIAEPDYLKKLEAGLPSEEFTPCIRCNDCHGKHRCTVNPRTLISGKKYPERPERRKRVAVIGGGPAGMLAAYTAAERGHEVVLFEKSDKLGGQLNIAAVPDFKWPLADYRDYLIRKVYASGAKVVLGTAAAPDMIKAGGYDAVICAVGSEPKNVPVEGSDAPFVYTADRAMVSGAELGKNVVVIGGATTGRETALHLAKQGHKVTMLTRSQAALFRDFHAQRAEEDMAEQEPNFSYIEHCSVEKICDGYLIAKVKNGIPKVKLGFGGFCIPGHASFDMDGPGWPVAVFDESNAVTEELRIEFDSVVISGGRRACADLAESFRGCAAEFYTVGDGVRPGDIRDGAGDAYDAAMSL